MALKQSLPDTRETLIHHSDWGVQYCSETYVKLLQDNSIKISMTENGDPLENAVAERINGIIKGEYLKHYSITTIPLLFFERILNADFYDYGILS